MCPAEPDVMLTFGDEISFTARGGCICPDCAAAFDRMGRVMTNRSYSCVIVRRLENDPIRGRLNVVRTYVLAQ
jgi:hypothetical protein